MKAKVDKPSYLGAEWSDFEKENFSEREILESKLRVAIMGEIIKARQSRGVSQKELEELSGVRQPVIARLESGKTNPQIETVLKLLAPLGKTLAVVPIEHTNQFENLTPFQHPAREPK